MQILKEELVNENSFLQVVKSDHDKVFLCCSYIDIDDGNNSKKDIIYEFTEENKNMKSVFQTDELIVVMDRHTKEISKIYNMEYHYFLRGTQCCTSYYEKMGNGNPVMQIAVESSNVTPVFIKTNLPRK